MRRGRPVVTAVLVSRAGGVSDHQSWPNRAIGVGIALVPVGVGAFWLRARVAGWEAAGGDVTAQRLYVLVLATVIATAFVAALLTMQRAISGDEPIVLLTLPLNPTERLRIAALRTLGDWRSMVALLGSTAGAVVLVPVAPFWALALIGGGWLGAVAGGAGAIWGVVAWSRIAGARRPLAVTGALATIAGLAWVARQLPITADMAPIVAGIALGLPLLATLVLAGPGASWLGRAYERAVQAAGTPSMPRSVRTVPGIDWIARRPGPITAMIAKDLLAQARDPFSLLRIVVTVAALPAYLQVRGLDALEGWSAVQLVAGFAAALTVYSLVDSSPSPIGAEGERLSLWWLAPVPMRDLLLAKVVVYLVPMLMQGIVTVAIVAVGTGMSAPSLAGTLALAALLVTGPVTFLTWGSATDLRLDVPLESGMPTALHEHVPHTPRRLILLSGTVLILSGMTVLAWRLPLSVSLPLLAALNAAIALACWRIGLRSLRSATSPRPHPA